MNFYLMESILEVFKLAMWIFPALVEKVHENKTKIPRSLTKVQVI